MKPEVRIVPDAAALFRAAADEFGRVARESVQTSGSFRVALSGGSTPKGLYSLLAGDAALRAQIPWSKIDFFWGDERHVPPDHADSNFRMAQEAMLSRVPVDPARIFRIKGELPDASAAASDYERTLAQTFALSNGRFPRFDLVLLGMGPDGHTASLFPGTQALGQQQRLAVSNWVGKFFTDRITLTPPVFNNAARVMFLVNGDDKAMPLKAVLEGPFEPGQLPAQLVRPSGGTLLWLLDPTAARLLSPTTVQEKS